jgi:phosphoglycerol transferase MdoB-like AlkP superfamily enzyme
MIYDIIIFLFSNSLKLYLIDNFVVSSTFQVFLNNIIISKFILYFLLNLIIFLALLRLKTRLYLLLFYILQAVYLFAHLAYFLYFKDVFHIWQFILQFFEGLAITKNFAIPKDLRYLIVFLDFLFLIPIIIKYSKFSKLIIAYQKRINLRRIFFFSSAVFLFSVFFRNIIIPTYSTYHSREELKIIERYGLFANDFLSLLFYKDEKALIKDLDYGKKVVFRNNKQAEFKNIICIQVEALDPNIIHFQYKGQYVTPFLHWLSTQCIYYPYMLSYRYGAGATSDIEFVVINSAIPLRYFPSMKLKNYDYPNSFIKRLAKSGFNVVAFHNNVGSFFNRDMAFLKFGFQEFYDLKKMGLKEFRWGAKDEDVLNYAKDKLKEQKSPFLYYIITMSSHEPFNLVNGYYTNKDYDDIEEELVRNYFNSISYVDRVLEDFVRFVQDNMNNTYIFIWGDHVCDITKSNLFKRPIINSVPLFIITPANDQYIENNKVASLLDLAPTVLYASGTDFEIRTKGVNLLDFPIKEDTLLLQDGIPADRQELFLRLEGIQLNRYKTK